VVFSALNRNFVDFATCTGRSGKGAKSAKTYPKAEKASTKSAKSSEGKEEIVDAKAEKTST
jgi:hypothetical protein